MTDLLTPVPDTIETRTALRSFLSAVLPSDREVVAGQDNRVSQPTGPYAVMTPLFTRRLATNVRRPRDVLYLGSLAGTTMTVSAITDGALAVGLPVYGEDVVTGTMITALGTGSGAAGTYEIAPAQTLSLRVLASGTEELLQAVEATYQIDFVGPSAGADALRVSTLLRDPIGCDLFAASGYDVAPIDADEPRQMMFVTGEDQYEQRWLTEVRLQANVRLSVGQQFTDALDISSLASVEATYPISGASP